MSMHNPARNSKRSRRLLQIELDQSEKLYDHGLSGNEAEDFLLGLRDVFLFVSPEEFDARMEGLESLGVRIVYRFDCGPQRGSRLGQRLHFQ